MSFLRPEVVTLLRTWREPVALAVVALTGLYLFRHGQNRADSALQLLGLLVTIPSALGIIPAIRMARLRKQRQDPGLVEINERRITYLGPHFGGSVSVDALTRIDIIVSTDWGAAPDIFWTLQHRDGPDLSIPARAEGGENLADAFAALPGFDYQKVIRAMGTTGDARFLIWETPR